MFLIPIVGGFLAGLLIKTQRSAMIITAALWVVVSGLLLGLALSEQDLTFGTTSVILVGLAGFPLALAGKRLRERGSPRA